MERVTWIMACKTWSCDRMREISFWPQLQ